MKEQLVKQKTSLKLAANENHEIIETNRETIKKVQETEEQNNDNNKNKLH